MFSIRRWIAAKMFAQQAVAANHNNNRNNGFRRLLSSSANSSNSRNYIASNLTLLKFYGADEELNLIAAELDSFDGRRDPVRCTNLVNQLRGAQDKVISVIFTLMDEWNCERCSRDYRSKFPDDLLTGGENGESLNGQIWFGAECLAAGSNIMNHETESEALRPMAKVLTNTLDVLRQELRRCCTDLDDNFCVYKDVRGFDLICKLEEFDRMFASFEFEYVNAMLPIKSVDEIEKLQELTVLFSETVARALKRGLIQQSDIDECQPNVMITIPRLAIVYGLVFCGEESTIYKKQKEDLSNVFKPFHSLIHRVYDLLHILRPVELEFLEKLLTNEESDTSNLNTELETKETVTDNLSKAFSKRRHSSPECELNEYRDSASKSEGMLLSKKCASTLSVMNFITALGGNATKQTKNVNENNDNVSVSSIATSTTASTVDSFELALAVGAKNSNFIPSGTKQLLHRIFIIVAGLHYIHIKQMSKILFLSGIADQMQSSYASDLRTILRTIFSLYSSNCCDSDDDSVEEALEAQEEWNSSSSSSSSPSTATTPTAVLSFDIPSGAPLSVQSPIIPTANTPILQPEPDTTDSSSLISPIQSNLLLPPIWVPDELVSVCTSCSLQFTLIRRRHHCRNCGQIYCNNCANNFIALTHYGFYKPVRVCNLCYNQ
ncbi:hypothetical protein B4U80_00874 [Leptotrombidium deliense]|uniref:Lateral signaling target protein 2 homolog n=1 Tax=Leptotrombidium deliense TaxID=299467 RepID=A0A443SI10_9ACAR|nr:hypothetical protein B4U80_00874 [Leptotrombidium deliense]